MNTQNSNRRQAAILAADVVGYSGLMEEDEERTLSTLNQHLGHAIQPAVEQCLGRIFKTTGDGFLAEFALASNAVDCAVSIQNTIAEWNMDPDTVHPMLFRIGVNLGEVISQKNDLFGGDVNIAARLEAMAEPGGVCISSKVYEKLEETETLQFENLGALRVKNLRKPVRAYKLKMPGFQADTPPPDMPDHASIAVLPFRDISANSDQAFFADGLTDSLITTLSRVPRLLVISSTSTQHLKQGETDAQQIATELGVEYVLQGTIQRAGNRIRISAQLIDGTRGSLIWGERYDRVIDDLFELQDEITLNILTACQVQLTEGETAQVWRPGDGAPNLQAAQLHWQALEKFRCLNKADNLAARTLWQQSFELAPTDPIVCAYIGYTYFMEARANWAADRKEAIETARKFAARAENLGLDNAVTKLLRAGISSLQEDYRSAVALARAAVELQPGNPDCHYVLGIQLNYSGHPVQALTSITRAMQLSPLYPTGYLYQSGISLFLNAEHEAALDVFSQCQRRKPESRSNHVWLATVYADSGDIESARAEMAVALQLDRDLTLDRWMQTEPFSSPEVIQRISSALKQSGIPR